MTLQPQDLHARYTALVSAIEIGYCLLEMQFDAEGRAIDYRFIETNPLFERHTGLANATGRLVREMLPDIEPVWIERYAAVARSGEAVHFEQPSEVMGRLFDVHAFPVGNPDEHLVGLLFSDVTAQRRRQANREFLAEVTQVFEGDLPIDEVMGLLGERLGDHLGTNSCLFCHIDEASDTITTSYGWTRAGEPNLIRTFKTSDYLDKAFIVESRARQPGVVVDTLTDSRTDAAAYAALNIRAFVTVPYHSDGVWTHYFGVTDALPRNWTQDEIELLQSFARLVFSKLERATAQEALRASEARFRAMANATPQIVWITDAEGRIEFLNRQWTDYTGVEFDIATAAEAAAEVVHPDDASTSLEAFRQSLHTGRAFSVEHRIRSATGEYRRFLVRAEPEIDPDTGRPCRWYGASMDIHDRWLAEQALAETDRRKDEFLATLAHELRNPLAPIRTGLTVLDMGATAEAAAKTRQVMARQLSHMVRLIDDLLDISRINSNKIELKREALDMRAVLDEAIEANRVAIDAARHRLFLSIPPKKLRIHGDRTRLVQVFGNLLSNASKYTPSGGRIDVLAEASDGRVVVKVQDNGIGIPEADLAGVFDMFAQVQANAARSQGGLGIGLALVKRLVEMHGGATSAESGGSGNGSVFTVALPLSAGASSNVAEACPKMPIATRPSAVIVVDDNVDAAQMMQAVLVASGHHVRTAHTGEEALRALDAECADVVLLDIGLPGIDGYQVARQIRKKHAALKIMLVALTGWGSEADQEKALESGFDHHLTKPVDARRVLELLARVRAD